MAINKINNGSFIPPDTQVGTKNTKAATGRSASRPQEDILDTTSEARATNESTVQPRKFAAFSEGQAISSNSVGDFILDPSSNKRNVPPSYAIDQYTKQSSSQNGLAIADESSKYENELQYDLIDKKGIHYPNKDSHGIYLSWFDLKLVQD